MNPVTFSTKARFMIRQAIIITALLALPAVARADAVLKNPTGAELVAQVNAEKATQPPGMTIEQCLNILAGLNALDCAGKQLNDPPSACKPDSKQYKLGPARVTVSMDIAALTPVRDGVTKENQAFISDLPPLPPGQPGKPDSAERVDAANAQNKLASAHLQKILAGACPVQPGRLKASDLNDGDGDGQNAIPPSVFGAIVPIVDGLK